MIFPTRPGSKVVSLYLLLKLSAGPLLSFSIAALKMTSRDIECDVVKQASWQYYRCNQCGKWCHTALPNVHSKEQASSSVGLHWTGNKNVWCAQCCISTPPKFVVHFSFIQYFGPAPIQDSKMGELGANKASKRSAQAAAPRRQ